jgi:alkylresorcinol/alkylpyrone synthase
MSGDNVKAYIVNSSTHFPERFYPQQELAEVVCSFLDAHDLSFSRETVRSLFENVGIEGRHFSFSVDDFNHPQNVELTANQAIQACVNAAEANVRSVLDQANLGPGDIDQIVSVTLTPAVPGIEARLMNRIAFRHDLVRVPLAGLGCMAGVAAINRAADYLESRPENAALVISCELSSALWQGSVQADLLNMIREVERKPDLHAEIVMAIVTAALFGDGSGALLMVGRDHALASSAAIKVLDTQSNWLPETEHIMGLDYVGFGMRNILRPEVKTHVGAGLRNVIEPMLQRNNLGVGDIGHWTLHPGGPKIMDVAESYFGLSKEKMRPSREALKNVGNISSATVLYMLNKALREAKPPERTPGLLVAMGPGFSQEAALVEWC